MPPAAAAVFGPRLALAIRYAELLSGVGVRHGLLGPAEVDRLWDRHLLNSAVVGELVPAGARLCDVGTGAGLPGLVLAIARPDLDVTLVEPMLRRVRFLEHAIELLGCERVTIRRERAPELAPPTKFDVVTVRAVAPLDRLVEMTVPLCRAHGVVLAVKGGRAAAEVTAAAAVLAHAGVSAEVISCGVGIVEPPTTVVRLVRKD